MDDIAQTATLHTTEFWNVKGPQATVHLVNASFPSKMPLCCIFHTEGFYMASAGKWINISVICVAAHWQCHPKSLRWVDTAATATTSLFCLSTSAVASPVSPSLTVHLSGSDVFIMEEMKVRLLQCASHTKEIEYNSGFPFCCSFTLIVYSS